MHAGLFASSIAQVAPCHALVQLLVRHLVRNVVVVVTVWHLVELDRTRQLLVTLYHLMLCVHISVQMHRHRVESVRRAQLGLRLLFVSFAAHLFVYLPVLSHAYMLRAAAHSKATLGHALGH